MISFKQYATHLPVVLVLVFSGIMSGCISLAPAPKMPEVVATMPASFGSESAAEMAIYKPLLWWHVFDDRLLNQVVDSALVANLDLISAVARVEEVRAQLRATRGTKFPAISGSANASKQDSPANTGAFSLFAGGGQDSTGGAAISRFNTTTYSASLGFSYELDFWGRIRNDTRAALSEARSTEADLETVRMGIISETISTYFEIADLRARIGLSVETLEVLSERVSLADDRYNRGLISSFELYQLRQDYRNTQANLPDLESQLAGADGRLAVLLGKFPGQLDSLLLTLAPRLSDSPVPAGLPADLLVQRPDVRAAAYRFEAARYRIGARRAELFPSLSLTGSVGTQASSLGDLLNTIDQWTLNLAAGLTAPIFQGGRLRASVDAAEAQYRQQAAAYAKIVLTAFQEATAALEAHEEQRQRYAFFLAQLEEAEAAADLQASRYQAGVSGYSDYLDALRQLQQVRTSLSAARRQLALARLSVHRSLGGGWTTAGTAPQFQFILSDVPLSSEGSR